MRNGLTPHVTDEMRPHRLDRVRVVRTLNSYDNVLPPAERLGRITMRPGRWKKQAAQDAPPAAVLVHLADALTVPDGGFSISPEDWRDAQAGYAVSVFPECEERIDGHVGESRVARYLMSHAPLLARAGVVFGGWRRPEDGVAYLDLSSVVPTRAQAIALAKQHGQVAVWDFAACRSISLIDVGRSEHVEGAHADHDRASVAEDCVAPSELLADEHSTNSELKPFRGEV